MGCILGLGVAGMDDDDEGGEGQLKDVCPAKLSRNRAWSLPAIKLGSEYVVWRMPLEV